MVTGSHVRHDQSFVLRDPAREHAVAAYVFTHEYAIAPSGEQGREAYVAYVGTLPDTSRPGPGDQPARPHPARLQGGRLRHLEPRRRHRQSHRCAGHVRTGGLHRALPAGQLRAGGVRSGPRARGCARARAGRPRRPPTAPSTARSRSPSRASPRSSRRSRSASSQTSVVTRSSYAAAPDPTPSMTSSGAGAIGCVSAQPSAYQSQRRQAGRPAAGQRPEQGVDRRAQTGEPAPALEELVGVDHRRPGECGERGGQRRLAGARPTRRCRPAVRGRASGERPRREPGRRPPRASRRGSEGMPEAAVARHRPPRSPRRRPDGRS